MGADHPSVSSTQRTAVRHSQDQALVKQLRRLEPFILRGSLIERFKRCGKPGCKCAQGPGHGPQVLFIGQPAWHSTADGLRPSGIRSPGLRVPPELSTSASTAGADLQRKSPVIAASGEILTVSGHGAFGTPARFGHGREARRQFSPKLVASRPGPRTSSSAEPS